MTSIGEDKSTNQDTRDIVLAIIDARGGQIRGRTVLQKLAFFVDDLLKLGVSFEPYFYGPYSDDVAISTDSLVASDFVDEDSKPIELSLENEPLFDPKVYEYRLTESGRKIVEARKKKVPVYEAIRRIIDELKASGLDIQNANVLAVAAKTVYIVKRRRGAKAILDVHDIAAIAKELGWEIPEDLIGKVLKSLERLEIIKLVNA